MKPVIYTRTVTLAVDYLRANDLNPREFKLATRSFELEQAVQGTTGCRVLILNGHPIDLHTWGALKARQVNIEEIEY